jgi:hypothetical protein
MQAFLCLPLLLVPFAPADRSAIVRAVEALNEPLGRAAVLIEDASSEFDRLPGIKPRVFLPPASSPGPGGPGVTISREPWGEATINFPDFSGLEALNIPITFRPRIMSGAIRFVTPEVALTDGIWTYVDDGGWAETIPVLLVMKKEGADWKVASVRVLATAARTLSAP